MFAEYRQRTAEQSQKKCSVFFGRGMQIAAILRFQNHNAFGTLSLPPRLADRSDSGPHMETKRRGATSTPKPLD